MALPQTVAAGAEWAAARAVNFELLEISPKTILLEKSRPKMPNSGLNAAILRNLEQK